MKLKSISKQFDLQPESIDDFSDWLTQQLELLKMEKRNRIRVRLLMEEMLLRMQEHFGADTPVTATLETALTKKQLRLEIAGETYNPLREENAELGNWNSSLLTAIGLHPKYIYTFGRNTLQLTLPVQKMNPALKILIAVIIGLLLGFAGVYLLSADWRQTLTNLVLTPFYTFWSRTLTAMAGPIIFTMAITTTLNTRQLTERGGKSGRIFLRYFLLSLLVATIAITVSAPFLALIDNGLQLSEQRMQQIVDIILQFVPSNLVEPFLQANTPQLLLIAFLCGAALITMSDQTKTLHKVVRQINIVALQLANWLSLLVPFFVGVFLCLELWTGSTA